MDELLLPERAVLLHIGPHKTGTTAIQTALRTNRAAMAKHGVVYPHHGRAARAVTDTKGLVGDPPAFMEDWERLAQQVAEADDKRVVISREAFCVADEPARERIVDELGQTRVHVVVTLRPLAQLLPSAWQQYVRNMQRVAYTRWLRNVLKESTSPRPKSSFWRRHHHDALVERWASIVGAQNVTVIMVDSMARDEIMRPFERLLGLPEGLLEPEPDPVNRSLTYGEIELVRYLNREFRRRGWSEELYRDVMYGGVISAIQRRAPAPDERRIATPQWALEQAAEIGATAAQRITSLGVRVVGDISTLGQVPSTRAGTNARTPTVPVVAAGEGLVGALEAGADRERQVIRADREARRKLPPASHVVGGHRSVNDVRSMELLSIVSHRARRRLRQSLRRSR